MRELTISQEFHDRASALDVALRAALPGVFGGVSTYGPDRPVVVHLDDSATKDDEALALSTVAGLDPATLKSNVAIAAEQSSAAAQAALVSFDNTADKADWHDQQDGNVVSKALALKLDELEKRIKALESR